MGIRQTTWAAHACLAVLALSALTGCTYTESWPAEHAGGGGPVGASVGKSLADWPVFSTPEELAERADTIITGVVRSSSTRLISFESEEVNSVDPMINPQAGLSEAELQEVHETGDGHVATVHTIEITGVLQGDVAVGDVVTVEQLGGDYDGADYVDQGGEQMQVGQEYLLFTRQRSDDQLNLVNPSQTIYAVSDSGALSLVADRPAGYIVEGTLATAEKLFAAK